MRQNLAARNPEVWKIELFAPGEGFQVWFPTDILGTIQFNNISSYFVDDQVLKSTDRRPSNYILILPYWENTGEWLENIKGSIVFV